MADIMAVQITGTRNGVEWPAPGQPVPADIVDAELDQLLRLGLARRTVAAPETAMMPAPETAMMPAPAPTKPPPSARRRRSA